MICLCIFLNNTHTHTYISTKEGLNPFEIAPKLALFSIFRARLIQLKNLKSRRKGKQQQQKENLIFIHYNISSLLIMWFNLSSNFTKDRLSRHFIVILQNIHIEKSMGKAQKEKIHVQEISKRNYGTKLEYTWSKHCPRLFCKSFIDEFSLSDFSFLEHD